ncbi:hypothetical protein [Sorangium cellulosum]|uniref:Uncharacterized protein n=1 Tax=Sorangium cellulosum TaxID=56 RepID=A0A150QAU4_SORCE|nr:hypothetical protein [Sorangium cellulosum]KYF65107.1 hypothetical protein BE15_26160 [Sorangium cellulosum]
MSSQRPEPDDVDPILEARVDHAVAPYADLLPAQDLEALRALTARFLATHPVAAPPVDRLRPRTPPTSSGEVERRDPAALAEAARRLAARATATPRRGRGGSR